jgi:hypothetical protein
VYTKVGGIIVSNVPENLRIREGRKAPLERSISRRYGKRAKHEPCELHDIALLSHGNSSENINLRKLFGLKVMDTPFQGPFTSSLPTQPLNSNQRRLPFTGDEHFRQKIVLTSHWGQGSGERSKSARPPCPTQSGAT